MSQELDTLNDEITGLVNNVLAEPDIDKTKQLIDLFNWNISKKNVARLKKLNDLFDNVTDKIADRFENKPDQFSNDDLLNYMKTIQGAITTSAKHLDEVSQTPPQIIQNNNTQINVNIDKPNCDRESRERILAAIQATLNAASQPSEIDTIEYEDKTEGDQTNESI